MESLSSPGKINYIMNLLLYQESEADEDKILEDEQFFRTKHYKAQSEHTHAHTHRENQVFIPQIFKLPNTTMVLRNSEGRHHLGHSGNMVSSFVGGCW